ncbi:MAG: DUF4876 domain-containing protein [Marinifilaceae bacterium]|jgi:hypothetical protein|nr:DUF4876 domain-containing protein [Marinifilaceae bacterium]
MKNTVFLKSLICFFACISLFSSCSDDENEKKISVKIKMNSVMAKAADADILKTLEVQLTDTRTMEKSYCQIGADGTGMVDVYKGTYNISVEKDIEQKTEKEGEEQKQSFVYSSKLENYNIVTQMQEIELKLNIFPKNTNSKNFIFSELFFNGETNSGQMMHPDRYYTIFNPSQETLYADGLCIATTMQYSVGPKLDFFDEYMPNIVPISGFLTIPGTGKEHPVKPGEKIVFALSAIDHSAVEGYDNAVDLSGADFEYYGGEKDIDNPEVPNALLTGSPKIHPRGFWASCLFKLENGTQETIDNFYNKNNKTYKMKDESEILLILLNSEEIIDGVITGDREMVTRCLPESVDRGYIKVSGCHRQELVIRKEIKIGNQIFYKDTNNTDEDFIIRKGQTAYPKEWRNK